MRSRLRKADRLVREGRIAEAVSLYDLAAEEFEREGFAVKAIAISRQIVELLDHSVDLASRRAAALSRLMRLYLALGLTSDAAEAERRLQVSSKDYLH